MKRVLAVLVGLAVIGGGAFAVALGQETRETNPAPSEGMKGRMGGMMGSGGMMGHGPMGGMSGVDAGAHFIERPWLCLALQHSEQLGLSADQAKTLESLRSEFRKEAIRRSAEIQVAELELAELLRAEPVDLSKVEAKLRQIEAIRTTLRLGRIKTVEKGKAILTPEQRKKLESLGPRASGQGPGGMMAGQGFDEMQRFMQSERMPQAMTAMMDMARQMGNGDPMVGMVRMMEMMSMMRQMGSPMGGMMGSPAPQSSK